MSSSSASKSKKQAWVSQTSLSSTSRISSRRARASRTTISRQVSSRSSLSKPSASSLSTVSRDVHRSSVRRGPASSSSASASHVSSSSSSSRVLYRSYQDLHPEWRFKFHDSHVYVRYRLSHDIGKCAQDILDGGAHTHAQSGRLKKLNTKIKALYDIDAKQVNELQQFIQDEIHRENVKRAAKGHKVMSSRDKQKLKRDILSMNQDMIARTKRMETVKADMRKKDRHAVKNVIKTIMDLQLDFIQADEADAESQCASEDDDEDMDDMFAEDMFDEQSGQIHKQELTEEDITCQSSKDIKEFLRDKTEWRYLDKYVVVPERLYAFAKRVLQERELEKRHKRDEQKTDDQLMLEESKRFIGHSVLVNEPRRTRRTTRATSTSRRRYSTDDDDDEFNDVQDDTTDSNYDPDEEEDDDDDSFFVSSEDEDEDAYNDEDEDED